MENPTIQWARDAYAAGHLTDSELESVIGAALVTPPPVKPAKPPREINWDAAASFGILALLAVMWHVAVYAAVVDGRHWTLTGLLFAQIGMVLWDVFCIGTVGAFVYGW